MADAGTLTAPLQGGGTANFDTSYAPGWEPGANASGSFDASADKTISGPDPMPPPMGPFAVAPKVWPVSVTVVQRTLKGPVQFGPFTPAPNSQPIVMWMYSGNCNWSVIVYQEGTRERYQLTETVQVQIYTMNNGTTTTGTVTPVAGSAVWVDLGQDKARIDAQTIHVQDTPCPPSYVAGSPIPPAVREGVDAAAAANPGASVSPPLPPDDRPSIRGTSSPPPHIPAPGKGSEGGSEDHTHEPWDKPIVPMPEDPRNPLRPEEFPEPEVPEVEGD